MNKNEIKQRLSEIRAEMQELEAKLNKPEKWVPKGGDFRVLTNSNLPDCDVFDIGTSSYITPYFLYVKSVRDGGLLAKHLKNQALLWQLANELNGDWVPDWGDKGQVKFRLCYAHDFKRWERVTAFVADSCAPVFKSEKAVKSAIDILNNMETGIEL